MAGIGDTFRAARIVDGTAHLWIIITDPAKNGGDVLTVSVTTLRDHTEDVSCILEPGEHPFIQHRSVISYKDARRRGIAKIDQAIVQGLLIPGEPVSEAILEKIIAGARKTKFLRELKAMLPSPK